MARTSESKKSSLPDYEKARDALDVNGKASGVTPNNFGWLFRCYAAFHGQTSDRMGVNINPIEHASQWGAWRQYRIDRSLPVYAMNMIGQRLASMDKPSRQAAVGFLVPCDWPADFDADRYEADDRIAADRFVAAQNKKREDVRKMAEMTPEDRANHVNAAMQRMMKSWPKQEEMQ